MDEAVAQLNARRLALQNRITLACQQSDRKPNTVRLIAMTKGHPPTVIQHLHSLGLRDFGENYVQEWRQKTQMLDIFPDIHWHFTGRVQTNKVKYLTQKIDTLHTLDRLELVDALEKELSRAANSPKKLKVFVQLKVDPDDKNKGGISYADADILCRRISESTWLEWNGFMGMGPDIDDKQELARLYDTFIQEGRKLWEAYSKKPSVPPEFSLGMSGDLEIAITAGSTMVRAGTALLGERPAK